MKKSKIALSFLLFLTAICFMGCSNGSNGSEKTDGGEKKYTITIDENIEHGSITASKESAAEGETINLLIIAAAGYKHDFLDVIDSDGNSITVTHNSFVMPAKDVFVSAGFREIKKHTVTYLDGVDNEDISVPEDTNEYYEDTTVEVIFAGIGIRSGYNFAGWSDGTTTYTSDGTTSFTIGSADVTLTAQWQVIGSSSYVGNKTPSEGKTVGDIVFNDGSATNYTSELTLTDEQKLKAIAIIFKVDGSSAYGVGLVHQRAGLAWCLDSANGYNVNFSDIQCGISGSFPDLVFTDDTDGSDNFTKIAQALGTNDDTGTSGKYPAFEFAKKYKDQISSHVNSTAYENGWYLPTVSELVDIWNEKTTVDAASELCGGCKFGGGLYWSSSQYGIGDNNPNAVRFGFNGYWEHCEKRNKNTYACCIRKFN